MNVYTLILCLLFPIISDAQKEKKTDLKFNDGIFSSSIQLITKISDKWSFERGLDASYTKDAAHFQVPFRFRFKVNEKLSMYTGSALFRNYSLNYLRPTPPIFGISAELGVQYDFTEDVSAKLFYQHNFKSKNNADLDLFSRKNVLKFKVGYKS